MVSLARYLRDLPPNEGGRSIKDRRNYPLGVAVETQLIDSLYRRTLHSILIQFFIQSKNNTIHVLSGDLYQGDPDLY